MFRGNLKCSWCGLYAAIPCRSFPEREIGPLPTPANDNRPPIARARTAQELLDRESYIKLGVKSGALQKKGVSRRTFPQWVGGQLISFQYRGGSFLCDISQGVGAGRCKPFIVEEDDVDAAFSLMTEENYGVNERFVSDCRWVSDWWRDCRTGNVSYAPQQRLVDRLRLIDLALQVAA